MDLIDRYLVAVRRHLPPPLQKDVTEELADSLRSEAEDRVQKAGRPLTDDDQAELLKKHGHPWLVTIATSFVDLMRPWRTRLFSIVRIANAAAFAGIVVIVLRARHWVDIVAGPELAERAARTDYWINTSIGWGLMVIMAIALSEALYEIWQLIQSRRVARG